MKANCTLFPILLLLSMIGSAQVTQINSNNSLHVEYPLTVTRTIISSDIDSSLWVSDATLGGTVQVSSGIKYEGIFAVLPGKFIFRGSSAATGSELFMTDGTPGGTALVKDIFSGTTGSLPSEMVLMNGFIYFTARTAAEGRELWRSDGTLAGTTLVKDIVAGIDSSNSANNYNLFTNGSYLLFAAKTPGAGIELWKSDGTNGGTALLKDINTGNGGADSSNPKNFFVLNSIVLFTAKDATHGNEVWKTDGSTGNTVLVKDINIGPANATSFELFPGLEFPVFRGFHIFNSRAYFNATDGLSTGEVWSTDGSTANTSLLKDIVQGAFAPLVLVIAGINLPAKFIFPVSDGTSRSELWESDGTPGGTNLFKSFQPANPSDLPFIFLPYDLVNGIISPELFQGNKFFFMGGTTSAGTELWVSDGNLANTKMVKDINPGTASGIDLAGSGISYLYTSGALFFAATTAAQGAELWRTDGDSTNTSMVADIYTNAGSSNPELNFICNGNRILFSATNGDDSVKTDLYVVNGTFNPIPIKLGDFTVTLKEADALLQWNTLQEINSRDFMIQRSFDGSHFETIGTVAAAGYSSTKQLYSFLDKNIANCGKETVLYRLLLSDKDGRYETSTVIKLKLSNKRDWSIQLLGNPVQQELRVLLNGTAGSVKISVMDVTGKKIYSNTLQNLNGQFSLPLAMQPGIYLLQVENNGELKYVKFVKQ